MNEAEARTSEELGNEQTTDTQKAQTSEQADTTPVSEPFTEVDITSVNRDDLSPEMQAAYDNMLERYNSFQGDYTQKMQGISQDRKDAENWRTVQSVPEIAMQLNDMISQVRRGEPIGASVNQTQAEQVQEIDPSVDPMGFIGEMFERKLNERLTPIERAVNSVVGSVTQNQSQLEFDNLKTEYPALVAIGLDRVNIVRSRHRDSMGQPISLRAAIGIMAVDNPAILARATLPLTTKTSSPGVELPKQTGSGRETTPVSGTRGLIDSVREAEKQGFNLDNLGDTFRRKIEKVRGK